MQVKTEYRIVSRVARLDGDQSDQRGGARTCGEVTVYLKILIDVYFRPLGAMLRRQELERSLKK